MPASVPPDDAERGDGLPQRPVTLDYLAVNVADWATRSDDQRAFGHNAWAKEQPTWGIFAVPESDLGILPANVSGLAALELGCGTGYVSAWLARRGARPIAFDPTPSQLTIAGDLQDEFGLVFPLVRAAGEHLPFADDSFDLAISEYGAAIWADPYQWIPEAARVLRPGGLLVFLGNSALSMVCAHEEDDRPSDAMLRRPQFGMHRMDWSDPVCTEFHLSHGDWIRLLRGCGFEILELVELRPRPGATTRYRHMTYEWARQWPCEEAWKVRLAPLS